MFRDGRVSCSVVSTALRDLRQHTLADNANSNMKRDFSAGGTVAQSKWAWRAQKSGVHVSHHFPTFVNRLLFEPSPHQLKREPADRSADSLSLPGRLDIAGRAADWLGER